MIFLLAFLSGISFESGHLGVFVTLIILACLLSD